MLFHNTLYPKLIHYPIPINLQKQLIPISMYPPTFVLPNTLLAQYHPRRLRQPTSGKKQELTNMIAELSSARLQVRSLQVKVNDLECTANLSLQPQIQQLTDDNRRLSRHNQKLRTENAHMLTAVQDISDKMTSDLRPKVINKLKVTINIIAIICYYILASIYLNGENIILINYIDIFKMKFGH